ncbi:MAG: type VI secretion system baseplate subunit TssF [Cellvibrionaceae bacterium]
MDDALLSYYNRELAYIRKMGAEFADQHPKIAGRLRLDKDTVEDPHVSRLIESFAFLTARIRHSIDDNFPELTEALMGILYPDFYAPFPSMTIIQARVIEKVAESKLSVPKSTVYYASAGEFGDCYYTTLGESQVLPVSLKNATFSNVPVKAPSLPNDFYARPAVKSVLKVQILPFEQAKPAEITDNKIRFYINSQPQIAFKLYEFLMHRSVGVAIARNSHDTEAIFIPPSSIMSCEFDETQGQSSETIAADGRGSSAHRKIIEYFVFPNKFLFVDIEIGNVCWSKFSDGFNLYIYFDQTHPELVQGVDDDTLMLGCTPAINLYKEKVNAFKSSHVGIEQKLEITSALNRFVDIHKVNRVYGQNEKGQNITIMPFYGSHLKRDKDDPDIYWHLRRENSQYADGMVSHGTDAYLSFVDSEFKVMTPNSNWVINADVVCTNRDVPSKLPFGPNQPEINFMNSGGGGLRFKCVTPPTSNIQPKLDDSSRWQLVTQLSLQSFSGENGLEVFKETLQLHDLLASRESRSIIDGITHLKTSLSTTRMVSEGRAAICQGTKITLEFDEHYYSGNGLYLFSAVLNDFFAQFCTINSFTQLVVNIKQKPENSIEWLPRIGKKELI